MIYIGAIIIGYGIGAIPTGILFCRILKGTDPRSIGSKSMGATNVARVIGYKWGVVVLLIDILKGYLPVVLLAPIMFAPGQLELGRVLIGAAAVSGHVWTIFAGFRGGKGVGTTAGVLLALDWSSVVICLGIWLFIFIAFRIVSIASMGAAIAFPMLVWLWGGRSLELKVASIAFALFLIYTHRTNIARLIAGNEFSPFDRETP
ncbi:glycerol-3-phosphate 1-O-acyltransferase PlsY [bacterium]|nr:glycerol-3-phosphate 1-O-acyltransferase PlsY [bacterium]